MFDVTMSGISLIFYFYFHPPILYNPLLYTQRIKLLRIINLWNICNLKLFPTEMVACLLNYAQLFIALCINDPFTARLLLHG